MAEPVTDGLGVGDDEGLELALRDGRRVNCGAARGHEHGQRGPFAGGAGLGQVLAGERFAASAHRIERVGLGAVAPGRAVRAVELDDELTALGEVASQTGAVAAGALDRPRPQPGVSIGQGDELGVAVRVGANGEVLASGASRGGDDRSGLDICVCHQTDEPAGAKDL